MKKAALIVLLVVVIAASFTVAVQKMQSVRAMTARLPNVLVVSFCSLRRNLLTTYGGEDPELMPNIEKFFKESTFAFENVLNGLSWTAIFGYTRLEIEKEFFGQMGYRMLGLSERNQLLRVPVKKSWNPVFKDELVDNSDFEKDVRPTLEYLERNIKAAKDTPFYLIAHVKYLHFPLIDRFNSDSGWDYFLNDADKAKVNEYLSHPEKYYNKLPFLLILANNPHHALMHPKVKAQHKPKDEKELFALGGLMTNPEYLAEWKASEGYADDLRLLEKIYRGNVRFVDKLMKPVLDLYGDKDLQKNTIMFFTGDHGEMHMERDELTHGLSLWDQALLVPFAVKFPDFHWPKMIRDQIGFQAMARSIRDILTGKNTASDFRESLKKYHDDLILGRDCNNTVRGLRFNNKYKYFVTAGDSQRYLFDLEKDPQELHNLADQQPGTVSQMESLYWQNYARFAASSDPFTCAPWVL